MRCLSWLIAFDPDPEEEYPSEAAELPSHLTQAQLDFVERETRSAQAREGERERGIQGRLVGLLGLTSLVTAALSATAAIATAAKPDLPPLQLVVILVPLGYIAVQAVAAMLFTLAGLMPRAYAFAPPWDGRTWDQSERLSRHITNLRHSMWSTNRRADYMVLALRSLKRFAWGSVALLVVLIIVVLDRRFDLISRLLDFLQRVSEG